MRTEAHHWRLGTAPWWGIAEPLPARVRVIIDNDFAGDPDDLYQLVHHLLSPGVDIRGIVCSHLAPGDPLCDADDTAAAAREVVTEICGLLGLDPDGRIWLGAPRALTKRTEPRDSEASRGIIAEALRDDPAPLYVVCGGGLTDLASAWLLEPAIAGRLTAVWIGGPPYPGLSHPSPRPNGREYNLNIDLAAAQALFGDSPVPLWQVPENLYRECLVSEAELRTRVAPNGPVGAYLYEAVDRIRRTLDTGFAETYALGDQPLVLLTALQSTFHPDPSSSTYTWRPCPTFDDDLRLVPNPGGRPIRVYTRLDNRLMFEDFFGKLAAFAKWAR